MYMKQVLKYSPMGNEIGEHLRRDVVINLHLLLNYISHILVLFLL
jgi:hypothetical protein